MKTSRGKKQVLIVDDHPMMREGLAQLIDQEPDLAVSAQAGNAAQALAAIAALLPDLVVLDISLPDRSGLEVIKDIQALQPGLPVLVVSMHDESVYAERVLRAGGRGYVMKQEGGKKLMQAIRQVLEGRVYVSEKMSARILEHLSARPAEGSQSPIERLSDREFEVLQLIGKGQGTRQIAERLRLSVKTVEVHRSNLKRKLELQSGTDLVRYAIRWTDGQAP